MSDETPKDENDEVEAHGGRWPVTDEPVDGDDEVEAHGLSSHHANDEPVQDGDDEVEAHRPWGH